MGSFSFFLSSLLSSSIIIIIIALFLLGNEGRLVEGAGGAGGAGGCYSGIFAFGTSLSDTGNAIRSSPLFFSSVMLPYGETYFGHAVGRYSDGRLFLDFLAESMGLPFLEPYLKYKGRKGADFTKGVCYAVSGATTEGPGYLLSQGGVTFLTFDSLDVQLGWHFGIQDMAEGRAPNPYGPGVKLPSPDVFSKALYYIEFGGNDYGTKIFSKYLLNGRKAINTNDASYMIPVVINKILDAMKALYKRGARNFFLYGQTPEGCAPLYLRYLNGTKDNDGCLEAFNQIDDIHNKKLLESVQALQVEFPDMHITVADTYNAYLEVFRNPASHGFELVSQTCCGAGPSKPYGFEVTRICSAITFKCSNPSKYLVWDGIHPTDALNSYIFKTFLSGKYIVPQDGLSYCASSV